MAEAVDCELERSSSGGNSFNLSQKERVRLLVTLSRWGPLEWHKQRNSVRRGWVAQGLVQGHRKMSPEQYGLPNALAVGMIHCVSWLDWRRLKHLQSDISSCLWLSCFAFLFLQMDTTKNPFEFPFYMSSLSPPTYPFPAGEMYCSFWLAIVFPNSTHSTPSSGCRVPMWVEVGEQWPTWTV